MTLTVEPQLIPLTATLDGVVQVTGTRVPLETVVRAFHQGATAENFHGAIVATADCCRRYLN